jgi:hypothetical protein
LLYLFIYYKKQRGVFIFRVSPSIMKKGLGLYQDFFCAC